MSSEFALSLSYIEKEARTDQQKEEEDIENSIPLFAKAIEHGQKDSAVQKGVNDDNLHRNLAEREGTTDLASSGEALQNDRPVSPETLALMCEEKDAILMADKLENGVDDHTCPTSGRFNSGRDRTGIYVEQEKVVLTTFLHFLDNLITHGSKGKYLDILFFQSFGVVMMCWHIRNKHLFTKGVTYLRQLLMVMYFSLLIFSCR